VVRRLSSVLVAMKRPC